MSTSPIRRSFQSAFRDRGHGLGAQRRVLANFWPEKAGGVGRDRSYRRARWDGVRRGRLRIAPRGSRRARSVPLAGASRRPFPSFLHCRRGRAALSTLWREPGVLAGLGLKRRGEPVAAVEIGRDAASPRGGTALPQAKPEALFGRRGAVPQGADPRRHTVTSAAHGWVLGVRDARLKFRLPQVTANVFELLERPFGRPVFALRVARASGTRRCL